MTPVGACQCHDDGGFKHLDERHAASAGRLTFELRADAGRHPREANDDDSGLAGQVPCRWQSPRAKGLGSSVCRATRGGCQTSDDASDCRSGARQPVRVSTNGQRSRRPAPACWRQTGLWRESDCTPQPAMARLRLAGRAGADTWNFAGPVVQTYVGIGEAPRLHGDASWTARPKKRRHR